MMDAAVMMFLGSLHQAGHAKAFQHFFGDAGKMRLVPCETGTEVSWVKTSHLGMLTEVNSHKPPCLTRWAVYYLYHLSCTRVSLCHH